MRLHVTGHMEGGFLNSPRAKCSKGFPLAFLSIQAQDWTTDINRFNGPRGSVYKSHAHLICRVFSSCMHCQFIRLPTLHTLMACTFFSSFVTFSFYCICMYIYKKKEEKKMQKDLDCINFLYQLFI